MIETNMDMSVDLPLEKKIELIFTRMRSLSVAELGILKLCCVGFGLLLGALYATKVKRHFWLLLFTFFVCAAYLAVRICFDDDYYEDDDDEDFDPAEFLASFDVEVESTCDCCDESECDEENCSEEVQQP